VLKRQPVSGIVPAGLRVEDLLAGIAASDDGDQRRKHQ
jgi:hypothetical protein